MYVSRQYKATAQHRLSYWEDRGQRIWTQPLGETKQTNMHEVHNRNHEPFQVVLKELFKHFLYKPIR